MSVFAGPDIVENNVILYFDAGNTRSYTGSGTVWTDLSNNVSASLLNGPTYSSLNSGSIQFDGINDSALVSGYTNPFFSAGSFSMEIWVYILTLPVSNPRFLQYGNDVNNFVHFGCYGGSNPGAWSSFWFEFKKNGVGYGAGLDSNKKYVVNTWYHLVATHNSGTGTTRLYENTVSRGGGGISGGGPATYNDIYISSTAFNGRIALLKVYNTELTQTEITQNFNATRSRFGI